MMNIKKMGGIGLVTVGLLFSGMTKAKAQEVATTLPNEIEGKITLTQNVTLQNKYVVSNGKTIILDLNGFTLTGPTTNYAIDNGGNLTITDSKTKKGSIICPASTLSYDSSCIRNNGTMKIENTIINANWTAVKNEETRNLTIENANITSTKYSAGVIMNYGSATVKNSEIHASDEAKTEGDVTSAGTAIYALSYVAPNGTVYSSNTIIENSVISGYWAVLAKQSTENENAKQNITITDSTIIKSKKNTKDTLFLKNNSTLEANGKITSPIEVLKYAKTGSTITLNEDVLNGNYDVPKDITLDMTKVTISKDATIKLENPDEIKLKENQVLVKNTDNSYSVLKKADYSNLILAVDKANKLDKTKYTEASYQKLKTALNSINYNLDESKQKTVDGYVKTIEDAISKLVKNQAIEENPQTLDSIASYSIIGIISLLGLTVSGVILKKKLRES